MLYGEFTEKLPDGVRKPTAEEYNTINLVYGYHPSISQSGNGKDQIARLYTSFGMRIIMDMKETAKRSEEILSRKAELEHELRELNEEYKELAMK